ncbi:Hypothetical protein SRAE_2000069200 [Strongyloides ratti]|uniref:Uncharacterized protein n=1 Tax=Strongyloides ratti TaxID=34506 RepID=A0A090MXU0_STRRB|nr:Hypothetical protein SRAE_2000069200 [Strongyloides ratti]CEF66019.1 Hypothetical protein SRAE_2000069200 [Strongyloides ratti]
MSQIVKSYDLELLVQDSREQWKSQYIIQVKLRNLENFKTNLTKFENIRFKNFKILYIDWDELQKQNRYSNTTLGFLLRNNTNHIYKISYTVGYYDGFTFNGLEKRNIICSFRQCDIGYVFFDKKLNYEKLNEKGKIYTVEYAVLVIVKSSSNIIVLQEVNYHKMNINIGLCPYINWVSKKGPVKFIPEDHIKDNGYFESSNGNAHIIIPFFKKSLDSNFFSCGKLKQPTLNDISIGYNLKYQNNENQYERKINPSHDNINCKNERRPG